ncbi:hypothetical protein MTO96_029683 [Rhipicephalus appendiculatus]
MTIAYMDVLCSHISSLSEDRVHRLDDEIWLELPKIRGKTVQEAVAVISKHIGAIPILKNRLIAMARMYCGLMVLRGLRPWILYRLDGRRSNPAVIDTYINMVRRTQVVDDGCYCLEKASVKYYCFMTDNDASPKYFRHSCFCVSGSYVAAYQAPEGNAPFTTNVLHNMLGGSPDDFRLGVYGNLDSAFAAARKFSK